MRFFNSNLKPSPTFVSSQGPWLVNAQGGRAFDTWLGSGSLIFGHGTGQERAEIIDMLPDGAPIDSGLFEHLEAAVGWQVGGIGFQTSGSSAIARACRLARAATGKAMIAVIKSFWHGSDDALLFTGADKAQISAGVPSTAQQGSAWFESIDQFLATAHLADYAAVLLEPYQGADPSQPTLSSSNTNWRSTLADNRVLLIADEIITGFRERFGSCTLSRAAQPDIVVFGKALANGFPVGLVLATPKVAEDTPKNFFWGGTFSASPTQLGAVSKHLGQLRALDYTVMQNNLACIGRRLDTLISTHQLKLQWAEGCGFARIKETLNAATPRAFVGDEKTDFMKLRELALAAGIYLGHNGLVFPSTHNIEESLP